MFELYLMLLECSLWGFKASAYLWMSSVTHILFSPHGLPLLPLGICVELVQGRAVGCWCPTIALGWSHSGSHALWMNTEKIISSADKDRYSLQMFVRATARNATKTCVPTVFFRCIAGHRLKSSIFWWGHIGQVANWAVPSAVCDGGRLRAKVLGVSQGSLMDVFSPGRVCPIVLMWWLTKRRHTRNRTKGHWPRKTWSVCDIMQQEWIESVLHREDVQEGMLSKRVHAATLS